MGNNLNKMVLHNNQLGFNLMMIFLTLCASLHLIFQETAGESIGGMVQNSKRRLSNNLTCYQCHSETEADCLNMTQGDEDDFDKLAAPCELNETMCMVKRISFTTSTGKGANNTSPMKLVSLKRVCAAKCEPGCLIMGERIRLYFCSTCCTTSKCNVGNSGSTTTPGNLYQSLVIILVVLATVAPFSLRLFQSNATFMTYIS